MGQQDAMAAAAPTCGIDTPAAAVKASGAHMRASKGLACKQRQAAAHNGATLTVREGYEWTAGFVHAHMTENNLSRDH
jgi:hypothetical protein